MKIPKRRKKLSKDDLQWIVTIRDVVTQLAPDEEFILDAYLDKDKNLIMTCDTESPAVTKAFRDVGELFEMSVDEFKELVADMKVDNNF